MRNTRNLEYEESQRLHWKVGPCETLIDFSPTHGNCYLQPLKRLKRNTSIGFLSRRDIKKTSFMYLGKSLCCPANVRQFKLDPPTHQDCVTCHLCVLNAHRSHQRNCPYSTPEHPRCECRPTLAYDLYDRHDIDRFLWHLKSRHLEYFERFRDLLTKLSVQRRLVYERERDVWEAQKMIRDVFGMGDDLI